MRRRATSRSLARVVLALDVVLELIEVEVHLAQVAAGVARHLIREGRTARITTRAARRDSHRAHARGELHHRHERVAARAIPLARAALRPGTERGERAPVARR